LRRFRFKIHVMAVTTAVNQAAEVIRAADALLITAGAGMGVDSGLPDFRGNDGFWQAYPVAAKLGLSFAELANPRWFENDPELAWAFYGHRLNLYRRTVPHAGFASLLAWVLAKPAGYFVFTSNVDGQFQKAGFDPDRVEECHGSIHHFQCARNCAQSIWDATDCNVDVDEAAFRARPPLPRCPHCDGIARPNILMFGDFSWLDSRNTAQHRHFLEWLRTLEDLSARLAVIELGAGSAIPTVRFTSERLAQRFGGGLIRINPREAAVPRGPNHYAIPRGALDGIGRLQDSLASLS
jgi:NAD-dependent SIR2 family protein deacetylase